MCLIRQNKADFLLKRQLVAGRLHDQIALNRQVRTANACACVVDPDFDGDRQSKLTVIAGGSASFGLDAFDRIGRNLHVPANRAGGLRCNRHVVFDQIDRDADAKPEAAQTAAVALDRVVHIRNRPQVHIAGNSQKAVDLNGMICLGQTKRETGQNGNRLGIVHAFGDHANVEIAVTASAGRGEGRMLGRRQVDRGHNPRIRRDKRDIFQRIQNGLADSGKRIKECRFRRIITGGHGFSGQFARAQVDPDIPTFDRSRARAAISRTKCVINIKSLDLVEPRRPAPVFGPSNKEHIAVRRNSRAAIHAEIRGLKDQPVRIDGPARLDHVALNMDRFRRDCEHARAVRLCGARQDQFNGLAVVSARDAQFVHTLWQGTKGYRIGNANREWRQIACNRAAGSDEHAVVRIMDCRRASRCVDRRHHDCGRRLFHDDRVSAF